MTASAALPNGLGVAIVTPFHSDRSVDHVALNALAQWQASRGIDFIVACGSTGEAQTLSSTERADVVRTVVTAVNGTIPVLAGATDNDTLRAVVEAREMSTLGVGGIMSAAPYYNKPTQPGLIAHFTAIADAISVPLLLYNVPGRSAIDIKPETVAVLANHSNIGGIKEASGSIRRILDLRALVPEEFLVMCGDDDVAVPAIACGASGLISVAGNAIPQVMAEMVQSALNEEVGYASHLQRNLNPFIDALFAESNPIPVKAVLAMMERCTEVVRLPLVPVTNELRERLSELLKHALDIENPKEDYAFDADD